jgi:hypothetical protein
LLAFRPALAYWNQRMALSGARERILELSRAVVRPTDLWPYQFAQLMAVSMEFEPDLILELGRGYGNSTCAFTEASNLKQGRFRVLSLCKSLSWEEETLPRLQKAVGDAWFTPLQTFRADILDFDYQTALRGASRVLVFWDAHGFDVAECVLGAIMPLLAPIQHLVIMHDLSDTRCGSGQQLQYGDNGLWKGNDWSGTRLKLGIIDSVVEQSVAILDFATRNHLTLDSADHCFRTELSADQKCEMLNVLGDSLFSLQGHWFYFSLNEHQGPYTFPRFAPPHNATVSRHGTRTSALRINDVKDNGPYLSVVVTARNDDHGGNLLGRMQAFVNAWIAQSARHGLSSEMIIVEWNPPPDRPPLVEALKWPRDLGHCEVRFITVPPEVHQKYAHAEALPLYQMIAKNAGIRRARGRFVLATNIDIIFNDDLVRHLAEGRLEEGRMYRIDRHDVLTEVPVDAPVDEQLAYCETHLIRVNAREGTYRLTGDGLRSLAEQDVVPDGSGIGFGPGWFAVEQTSPLDIFRWAENDAEIIFDPPSDPAPPLWLDLEPGPGVGHRPFRLQVVVGEVSVVAETLIKGRSNVKLELAPGTTNFRLRAIGGGRPTRGDPRILNFRVFQCEWGRVEKSSARVRSYRLTARRYSLAFRPAPLFSSPKVKALLHFYRDTRSIGRSILAGARYWLRSRNMAVKVPEGEDVFQRDARIRPGSGWYPLEHWLGETFRWVRRDAKLIISAPNRGPCKLFLQVEPGPGVNYKPFELLVRDQKAEVLTRVPVRRLQLIELTLPLEPGQVGVFSLDLEGGDLPAPGDPRLLNFRISWCGWSAEPGAIGDDVGDKAVDDGVQSVDQAATVDQATTAAQAATVDPTTVDETTTVDDASAASPVYLHTNACGDFTLMAREHWVDLRGYPEFDMYSMNLDSVLCYAAHHAGFREEILRDPLRIYHIEHSTGSGWTPEGQARLFARLAAKGVGYLDYQELVGWATHMRRLNCPMIFNRENWGLADVALEERILASGSHAGASG